MPFPRVVARRLGSPLSPGSLDFFQLFFILFELAFVTDPIADLGTSLSSRPPFVASAPRPSVGGLRPRDQARVPQRSLAAP